MWENFKKIRNFKETSYLKSENDRSRLHNEERNPAEFETHRGILKTREAKRKSLYEEIIKEGQIPLFCYSK